MFLQREQLREHEDTLRQLEVEIDIHKKKPPERGSKHITLQFYKEKEAHLNEEVKLNKLNFITFLKTNVL